MSAEASATQGTHVHLPKQPSSFKPFSEKSRSLTGRLRHRCLLALPVPAGPGLQSSP